MREVQKKREFYVMKIAKKGRTMLFIFTKLTLNE